MIKNNPKSLNFYKIKNNHSKRAKCYSKLVNFQKRGKNPIITKNLLFKKTPLNYGKKPKNSKKYQNIGLKNSQIWLFFGVFLFLQKGRVFKGTYT